MDANKYKKWGWGAVIGLVGVILISALVIAVSMSSPKKIADDAVDTADAEVAPIVIADDDTNKNENKTDEDAGRDNDAEKNDANKGNTTNDSGTNTADDSKNKNSEDNSSKNKTGNNTMPKTGPEDEIASIIGLAVVAGLATHLVLMKRSA